MDRQHGPKGALFNILCNMWVSNIFPQIIDQIGRKRVCCVSSDNTGNTRVSRDILCDVIRTMLNLPDPNHHMSNTIKDIVALAYFAEVST
jgi:hypothetical protein